MKFQTIFLASIVILGCGEKSSRGESKMAEKRSVFYFSDVSEKSGLGGYLHENGAFGEKWFPEPMGAGGGFIDYNGDSWEDILLITGGIFRESGKENIPAIRLLHNNTDGTFSDVSDEVGLGNVFTYPFGIAAADFDNDGDQDFLLTTLYENLLFKNTSGYFTEVGSESGLSTEHGLSTSPIFFDADRDGHLDLYVGNYTDWSPDTDVWCTFRGEKGYCTPEVYNGIPSRYYKNNGDGSFTDRTLEAGFLPAPGKTLGVAEYDYNKDGWPDLYVSNDFDDPDALYHNQKDGTFVDVTAQILPHTAWFSMGADSTDIDGDGWPDLLAADMSGTTHYKDKTTMGAMGTRLWVTTTDPRQYMRNALYLGTGTGRMMEAAYLTGIADSDWTWAVKFADFDGDGRDALIDERVAVQGHRPPVL